MSLEAAITDLNANLVALVAAIKSMGAPAATQPQASDVKATGKNTGKPPEKAADKSAEKPAEKPADKSESPDVSYDDVKAAILKLATEKGRDSATAILQRHGVSKAPDLKPTQWAAVLKDTNAAIGGTYDPEASEEALA